MIHLAAVLAVASVALPAFQLGGGSAAYQERRQSGLDSARATELAKRTGFKDEGRAFEASVLMNVKADEYVAVFAVNEEGKTLDEARRAMDATIKTFTDELGRLKLDPMDWFVDFIAQNRIYGYEAAGENTVREVVVGFEVKKNVSIHYRDKDLLDRLMTAASKARIFDLVKVDYVVKDVEAVQSKLLTEASRILKRKMDEQEKLLGVKVTQMIQAYPVQYGAYFPTGFYDSYVAQESEEFYGYRQGQNVQRARKPRTFHFNGLTASDFDHVVNPVVIEPVVQFTIYVRVRY